MSANPSLARRLLATGRLADRSLAPRSLPARSPAPRSLPARSLAPRSLPALSLAALSAATFTLSGCATPEPAGPDPVELAAEPLDGSLAVVDPLPAPSRSDAPGVGAEQSSLLDAPPGGGGRPVGALVDADGAVGDADGPDAGADGVGDDLEDVDSFFLVEVRPGESIYSLAVLVEVTPERLAEINDMDVTDPLLAGRALRLPRSPLRAAGDVLAERDRALAARLGRYLDRRGGELGVTTRRVRTGDTAWSIAHGDAGVPTWVLAAYNPDVDLDRLRIGDELRIPVFGDSLPAPVAVDEAAREGAAREGAAAASGKVAGEVAVVVE